MVITREMFENASNDQMGKWQDICRWYYFTFEARGSNGYAPRQYDRWFRRYVMFYNSYEAFVNDEFLEWASKAITIWMAAGEPTPVVHSQRVL